MAKRGKKKALVNTPKTPTMRLRKQQHHPAAVAALICSMWPPGRPKGATIKVEDSLDADLCKFADATILIDDFGNLIHNNVTRFFRRLNVWEYKGPEDSVGWKAVRKGLGYVQQKCLAHEEVTGEMIALGNETITIVGHKYPRQFLKDCKEQGMQVVKPEAGVYQIDRGPGTAGLQFIIIPQLDRSAYPILRALGPAENVKDVQACIEALAGYHGPADDRYAKRIVEYMLENLSKEVMAEVRKDKIVNEALLAYANPDYLTEIKKLQSKAIKSEQKSKRFEQKWKRSQQECASERKRADTAEEKNVQLGEENVKLGEENVKLKAEIARLQMEKGVRK